MKYIFIIALSFTLVGCLKTAEQLKREQRVDSMSQQLSDSQNIVADLTVMLKSLQSQIDALNGKVEELQRSQQDMISSNNENQNLTKQQIEAISNAQTNQAEEIKQLRSFVEKVTDKLGKINAPAAPSSGASSDKAVIDQARKLISAKKFKEAKSKLESLLNDSKINAADMNKVLHGLGEIEFAQKQWEKSLVYFSKIYTKYPKSSLAPTSLLHIGKALNALGKKDESKQAFDELKSNYPNSAAAKEVK